MKIPRNRTRLLKGIRNILKARALTKQDRALLELRARSGKGEHIYCFRKDSSLRKSTISLALVTAVLRELLVIANTLLATA